VSTPEAIYILETRDLTRRFGDFVAVKGVSLKIKRHAVHALIGPNGAGKTTCFNLLSKFLKPTSGAIFYNGREITNASPATVARQGLIRSFQITAVFGQLTALENLRVSLQRKLGVALKFWRPMSSLSAIDREALALLDAVGLAPFANTRAGELSYGRRRALEIATTIAQQPEVMLLDEPTSGLGAEDIERVTELIRKAARNRTVVMVEHNLGVVAGLCDRITVLQRGEILAEGTYEAVSRDPRVLEAYTGGEDE
jgi:branched-chain amino acid transport system ATP-binding protein